VMDLHGFGIDHRLERVKSIRQGGNGIGHGDSPSDLSRELFSTGKTLVCSGPGVKLTPAITATAPSPAAPRLPAALSSGSRFESPGRQRLCPDCPPRPAP